MSNDVVGGPVPVMVDSKQLFFTPLTDEDEDTLDKWVRMRLLGDAEDFIAHQGMVGAAREEYRKAALLASATATWLSSLGSKFMSTLDGIAQYLSLSLMHKHPDMDFPKVEKMVRDRARRDTMLNACDLANFPQGDKAVAQANPTEVPQPAESGSTVA